MSQKDMLLNLITEDGMGWLRGMGWNLASLKERKNMLQMAVEMFGRKDREITFDEKGIKVRAI